MPDQPVDLFISYSRTDSQFVNTLDQNLRAAGYTTWVDRRKLEGGDDFHDVITQAITNARAVLVVLSPRAANSRYVREEIAIATSLAKPIIPILWLNCRPPKGIAKRSWINFSQSYEAGWKELLVTLQKKAIIPAHPADAVPLQISPQARLRGWDRWLNVPRVGRAAIIVAVAILLVFASLRTAYPKGIVLIQQPTPTPKTFKGNVKLFTFTSPNNIAITGAPTDIAKGADGTLWFTKGDQIIQLTTAGAYTGFSLAAGSGAEDITLGPDGNVWFSETTGNRIGRITPDGTIKEFNVSVGAGPYGLTSGPDGNLWFTEQNTDYIGRISVSGDIKEFPLTSLSSPSSISSGPDGNLWFVQDDAIGRITPVGVITEFPLPSQCNNDSQTTCKIADITSGPDGNLWFTESFGNKIGRITPAGAITEFLVPSATYLNGDRPQNITSGPDGNLWFTKPNEDEIGRISTKGDIITFPLKIGSGPQDIIVGPDGNLWFTGAGSGETLLTSGNIRPGGGQGVGRISVTGIVKEFPFTSIIVPASITSGSDNNLWFTEPAIDRIGQISLSGAITEFSLPTTCNTNVNIGCYPQDITLGSDGNLWFTETGGNRIGQSTPTGAIKEFSLPTNCGDDQSGCQPFDIISGPDGNLWFTELHGTKIGRITPNGAITEFSCGDGKASCGAYDITNGPDKNLWFTDNNDDLIGRITPSGTITLFPLATGSKPQYITSGPDGNLWFTESSGTSGTGIVRITPTGVVKEFQPTLAATSTGITNGPDGNLWFGLGYVVERISPNGVAKHFTLPTTCHEFQDSCGVLDITRGSDGNLWFTGYNETGGIIGELT